MRIPTEISFEFKKLRDRIKTLTEMATTFKRSNREIFSVPSFSVYANRSFRFKFRTYSPVGKRRKVFVLCVGYVTFLMSE